MKLPAVSEATSSFDKAKTAGRSYELSGSFINQSSALFKLLVLHYILEIDPECFLRVIFLGTPFQMCWVLISL